MTLRYTFTTPDGRQHERLSNRAYDSVLVARPSLEYAILSASTRDREVDSRNWAWNLAVSETKAGDKIVYLGKVTLITATQDMIDAAADFIRRYPSVDAYAEKSIEFDMARVSERREAGYYVTFSVLSYHHSPTTANLALSEARSSQVWSNPTLISLDGEVLQ